MKNLPVIFIILLFIITPGCVTMPDPINEAYLSEKTNDESAKLDKIEAEIVTKNKNKETAERNLEIAVLKMEVSRKEVLKAEAINNFLVEKEKLFTLTGENQKLADIQKQKEANKVNETQLKALMEYNSAKKDEVKALLDIKKGELGLKVAELDYEKSLIVKAYQIKRGDQFKKNKIDDSEYKKYLDKQKKDLEENQKKYEKASKVLSETEIKLKKTGYEVEK